MSKFEFFSNNYGELDRAINSELEFIRKIGSSKNLVFTFSNLGAYEAVLFILKNREQGVPVYEAIASTSNSFSGPAGVINRINAFRRLGLLEEKVGQKKSQVCLVPSDKLLLELGPIICDRLNVVR